MTEFLQLMLPSFVACLVLTGMHAYLGLHVVERGVIFVDLALAQIAAFGATLGFLWGLDLHSFPSYLISLTATLCGAALFAITRFREQRIPQEALIGVTYAVAASAAILVLSRAPEGGEELKNLMVGHLLFIGWPEIAKIAVLYSIVGIVHYAARGPLLEISQNPEGAFDSGRSVRLWDFLFYGTFGLVVTSSTEVAGVLLVFSFLVVPALCGVLLGKSIRTRLIVGWAIGAITSIVGISLSYIVDLPTGATIVCIFGVTLVVVAVAQKAKGQVL